MPPESDHFPTLYSFRRCPYAMRARMALCAAKITYQTVEVSLRDKPAELLALSPKATVPVLHLQDGTVLAESLDIMRWALLQRDPEGWLTAVDASDIHHWIELCDTVFKPLLDRYKYANRHPELSMAQHRAAAVSAFILPLETALSALQRGREREGLERMRFSLADVAMFPFVRQFAAVDPVWFDAEPFPAVQAWLAAWLSSDLWKVCMVKMDMKAILR